MNKESNLLRLGLSRKKKMWEAYYQYEKKHKAKALRNLSPRDGFNILQNLYAFSFGSHHARGFDLLHRDKLKNLSKIHSLFGKVK